jgi:AAA domain/Bifunctional DNA primase/polymerase, N-terminal/Primase C terminal 2 (PriCT-2)
MSPLEKALSYAKAGIAVIPCEPANKEPIWALVPKDIGPDRKPIPRTGGVKKATRDPKKIAEWWGVRPDAMIGGATGEASGFWAIDPDVPKPKKNGHAGELSPDGAAAWEKLKAEYGGHAQTVEVTTPSGGRHIYFRCDPARPPGNREGNLSGLGINVRGNGGYVILPPSRRWPDGKAYEANRPFAPGAIAEAPAWLYDLILRAARKQPTPGAFPHTPENERNLRDALSTIPADARDMWLKIGGALHALAHEWSVAARHLWDEWSQSEPGSFDPEDQDATWQGFDSAHPNGATVGTIFFEAKERGWRKTSNGEERVRIAARPFVRRDPKTIPPRQWLYGQHYIGKFVSATIAAPGIGKSSLDLVELIAMASGRPLLGVPVPNPLRVWYWNLEDPYDEIERRVAAALLHFNIDPAEIDGRLFVNSGRDDPLVIAEMIKGAVAIHAPLIDAIAAEIIARGVDVLSIDPFVSCHRIPENDNGAIDAVTKTWAKVADAASCSIDLVHHVRKPANNQAEFDVNDARGASALIGTVRAARVLNSMTENDAQAARVPLKDKGYYFQIARGKANMSPPAEKADWYKFVSVPLGNDTAETKGDDVGVVTKWKFPGLFDDMAVSDLFAIQKAIAAGQWRADARSPDWAGNAVAKVLELDVAADKKRIKAMLKIWIETGALKEAERKTEQRKPSLFVEVGNWANT